MELNEAIAQAMYRIEQIGTGLQQTVSFKSEADANRYWKFFVENEDVIRAEYVNPLLIADVGYSLRQLKRLDFLNYILPIPIFSERFVEKNAETLKDDLLFFPCSVQSKHDILPFYMGRILNISSILDVERSGKWQLTDGSWIPDVPFVYHKANNDHYIVRDATHRSHYVASERLREIGRNYRIEWNKVALNKA